MLNWTEKELEERLAKNPALRVNQKYSSKKKGIKEYVPTEEEEQERLAVLLDDLGLRWAHIPNGGLRHIKVAKKLRKAGVKSGVPDILIFTRPPKKPGWIGLAIELKRRIGGVVSDNQKEWLQDLERIGWVTVVCRGYDEAVKVLKKYGYMRGE